MEPLIQFDNSTSKHIQSANNSQNSKSTDKKKKFSIFSIKPNKKSSGGQPRNIASISDFDDSTTNTDQQTNAQADAADNILKKYDFKSLHNKISTIRSFSPQSSIQLEDMTQVQQDKSNTDYYYDAINFEKCKAFDDAKKKLRLVLAQSTITTHFDFKLNGQHQYKDNYLLLYLKIQLYEAISIQDGDKQSNLDETIRCIELFSEQECLKLIRSLKADHRRRFYYVAYLTKSKKSLLYSIHLIDKLIQRVDSQQKLISYHLTVEITRSYLNLKETQTQGFIQKFRALEIIDEKFDLYKKYVKQLCLDLNLIWSNCKQDEIDYAYLCVERLIMARVYTYAMYPNGDIDHYRDRFVRFLLTHSISTSHFIRMIVFLKMLRFTLVQVLYKHQKFLFLFSNNK
jgi:hypothetical protein